MKKDITLEFDDATIKEFIKVLGITHEAALAGGKQGIDHLTQLVHVRMIGSCPIDTGALRQSAYWESETVGDEINANVGHGGKYEKINPKTFKGSDSYAVELHESYRVSRESARMGATWKWAEKSLNSVNRQFLPILQEYIKAALLNKSTADLRQAIIEVHENLAKADLAKKRELYARLDRERTLKAKNDIEWQALLKSIRSSKTL